MIHAPASLINLDVIPSVPHDREGESDWINLATVDASVNVMSKVGACFGHI